jgi:hypothetical protein
LGNGDGSFQTARSFPVGINPWSVAVADFDGDGHVDLALAGGSVRVLRGSGDGSFQTPPISYIAGISPVAVAVADFNGKGLPDLAVANYVSNDVSILLNDGSRPGPNPPPGPVPRRPNPPALFVVPVENFVRVDPRSPAASLPGSDVNRPLLGGAEQNWLRAAGSVVATPQSLATVWARGQPEEVARWLTDRLFAACASSWLCDRSADPTGWSGT